MDQVCSVRWTNFDHPDAALGRTTDIIRAQWGGPRAELE